MKIEIELSQQQATSLFDVLQFCTVPPESELAVTTLKLAIAQGLLRENDAYRGNVKQADIRHLEGAGSKPASWSSTKPIEREIRRAENEKSEEFAKVLAALEKTGLKFKTEAQWGTQIFDFWCVEKGCGIYVKPTELMLNRGTKTNKKNRIEIISIFDTSDYPLSVAIGKLMRLGSWNSRRRPAGLKPMASGGPCYE